MRVDPDGSVALDLGEACIETAARRAYADLAAALLDGREAGAAAGVALGTLEAFLRSTDFAALRAGHPELAGHRQCRVRISMTGSDSAGWKIEVPG